MCSVSTGAPASNGVRRARAVRLTQVRTAELELAPRLECDALAIKLGADDEVLFEDGLPTKPGLRGSAP